MSATPDLDPFALDGDAPLPHELEDARIEPDLLAAVLDEDRPVDPVEAQAVHGWTIEDDGAAEWAMRRVAALDAKLAHLAELRDGWASRIAQWFDRSAVRLGRERLFFAARLVAYQERRRLADKRAKTLTLPSGDVTSTATGGNLVIVDKAAVVAWAEALGGDALDAIVKVTKEPLVSKMGPFVKMVDREAGSVVKLECGHLAETDLPPAQAGNAAVRCDVCPADPIDGPPLRLPSAAVAATERIVVDADGARVPGVAIAPEGLDVKVRPRG